MSDDLSVPNSSYRGNRPGRYGAGQSRSRQGMEPATRRLMLFAVGVGSVLVALIGASAIVGHRSTEVPVVTADSRPLRERPVDPGGLKVGGADNELFSGGGDTSNARLAPPAETPDPKTLHPLTAAPVAPPIQAPVKPPVAAAPPAPALLALPSADTSTPPPAARAQVTPAPVPAAPGNKQVAVVPGVVSNSVQPAVKPAPAKPAAPAAAPTADAHPAATPGHQPVVQLAAVATEEGARQEWEQLTKRMPDLLKGHQPNYSHVEREGRTYWRIRTTGFTDVAQARSFCEHVHAKGGGCSVADF